MCGIAVKLRYANKEVSIEKMIDRLQHRGETRYVVRCKHHLFAHTRLAIQGITPRYDQPYSTRNEIVLYNGEIYNYKSLGKSKKIICDTPLLVGRKVDYNRFDGMFAVVKYFKHLNEFEIVTDPFGQKQLYYRLNSKGEVAAIASEIKALVLDTDTLNTHYFARIHKFGYSFGDNATIVNEIKRFMPGMKYRIKNGMIICERIYFDGKRIKPKKSHPGDDLYKLMDLAVKRRLVSDRPVCVLLSGGIDSSIILHHVLNHKDDVEVFTVTNGRDYEYAKRLCEEIGVKLNRISIPRHFNSEKIHLWSEMGCDLGSVIPNYLLFREIAKRGYKVVLSGDGADEIFRGYKRNDEFDCLMSDIFDELIFYHMPRLDKLSMAHTIELRCPFMARYIIEHGLSLSYEENNRKSILKETYRGIIPDYILDRPKEPLKIGSIRKDKESARKGLLDFWKYNFDKFKSGDYL